MSNRLKRILVLMSLGGTSFFFMGVTGTGCSPFAQNQPFVDFLVQTGNYGVALGVDQALANVGEDVNNWFNDPITGLYQSLWGSGVRNQFPEDPTFNALLVE